MTAKLILVTFCMLIVADQVHTYRSRSEKRKDSGKVKTGGKFHNRGGRISFGARNFVKNHLKDFLNVGLNRRSEQLHKRQKKCCGVGYFENSKGYCVGLCSINPCNGGRCKRRADKVICDCRRTGRKGRRCTERNRNFKGCPDGWVVNNKLRSCYLYIHTEKYYKPAELDCEDRGGHLLAIETKVEGAWIYKQLNSNAGLGPSDEPLWLNLNRNQKGEWKWQHNKSKLNFSNWAAEADLDDPNKICGGLMAGDHHGFKWINGVCNLAMNFICEINY